MKFDILPYVGAGRLVFGMHRDQVRALMDGAFSTAVRNKFATHPSDYFLEAGLIAEYDTASRLEFIEIIHPAQAVFDEIDMLQMNFQEALSFLSLRDQSIQVDKHGGMSKALGIGFWASRGDDSSNDDLIQNVYVFPHGYYDE